MCLKSYGLGQDPTPPLRKNSITNLVFFRMASLNHMGGCRYTAQLLKTRIGINKFNTFYLIGVDHTVRTMQYFGQKTKMFIRIYYQEDRSRRRLHCYQDRSP